MEESRFFMEKIGRDAGRRDGHQKPLACWPGNRWKKPSLGWPSMQRDPVCMERRGWGGGGTAPTVCIREGEQTEEMASGILLKTPMRGHRWLESAV